MSHFHLDVHGFNDGSVVFKLELRPEYPQQSSLLMRSNGGQQEQPLEFLVQANGHDYFTVALTASQPFEYALRVTTPGQSWWITPKGEEHDRLPHNWFHWPQSLPSLAPDETARNPVEQAVDDQPQSLPSLAPDEAARNPVEQAVGSKRQGAVTVWLLNFFKPMIRKLLNHVSNQFVTPPIGDQPQSLPSSAPEEMVRNLVEQAAGDQPQSLPSLAPEEAARNPVEQTVGDQPQARPAFATPAWVRDAVFYQIFPERFDRGEPAQDPLGVQPWGSPPTNGNFMGGNLQGILDRLGYLTDLGVTALYLTPIFHSPSNHKYDTMDYFTVDPHLGDLKLLRRLVDTCHQRGLHVVLDGVFNHCSDQHPFFLDVKRHGQQSRYWNWFHIRNWPFPDHFGHHAEVLHWYDCWWGFHTLPKLNYHHPEVEEYFLNVATYWLREAGTDGWRLDVPNEVIQSFWPKFRRAVKAVKPDAYIVGEIWDDATPWLQGDQFDAVMNYRFQKALIDYFAEEHMDTRAFDHTLRHLLLAYPEPATAAMLNLLGSHDTARPMTVVRRRDDTRHALESLKLMVAMQFTCAGAPCIYYGDEIGLEGDKDPDCRRCYPWGWEKQADDRVQRAQLLAYYKTLIAVRKANPALRRGAFHPLEADPQRQLYAFERRCPDNHCIVALNRSGHDHALALSPDLLATELLSNHPIRGDRVTVPARQAIIVRLAANQRHEQPKRQRAELKIWKGKGGKLAVSPATS